MKINDNQPLVSIIVPCYNQACFLPETLDSVLAQSYTNWQCIIVNDGSPDNTDQIAARYCKMDGRFKYVYQENGGLSSARNAGIVNSCGKYILPLDSDDKIGCRYTELAVDVLECDELISIVYCRQKLFGYKQGENHLDPFDFELMLCKNLIFCTALYRRADYDKTRGYNENMIYGFEDWDFWLSILENGGKVHQIDEILFYYRIRRGSMAASLCEQRAKAMRRQIWENHRQLYAEHFVDPSECFEYQTIKASAEYRIGRLLLLPVRKMLNLVR